MPQPLMVARWLVYVLFGATVLGGIGLFLTAASLESVNGTLLGLLAYAAAPGTVGWVLARRAWTGGVRVWWGLIAVQAWLVLGGLSNIREGSVQGFTQLFLPVVILVFLCRAESREWFRLAERERAERPPFSLPHMIKWRRDRGQTAMEYVGLITLVAAIILALALGGVGGQITDGLRAAICSLTGTSCPAGGGTGDQSVEAGSGTEDQSGPVTDGGTTTTGGTTGGGTGGGPGGDTATGGTGGDSAAGGTSEGTGDGASEGASEGASGGGQDTGSTSEEGEEGEEGEVGDPTDPYEPIAVDDEETDDDKGADGEKKEECSGFFGCTLDQLGQVGEGVIVDGIVGDVTDLWDTVVHPIDTVTGIADYGKSLGDKWSTDSKDAGDKWDKGDYWDALTDWGGASVGTGTKVLDDTFVGEEVREAWNRGEETQAVSNVVWNVGSLFIPGYNAAKVAGKASKLGKLGKLAQAIADVAGKAKDASNRARKAAGLGDAAGARKAADEAQEHADDAVEKAEEHGGCTIALGGLRLVPYEGSGAGRKPPGVPGSGTGILAAGPAGSPLALLAAGDGLCEGEEADKARDAQREADDADRAADGAELSTAADRAKQTILDAKDKQKTPKSERYSLNEGAIDKLVARAKDDPDLSRGEFGKDELASALDDLTDMLNDKRINNESRGSLAGTVLKATDRHQLAEAMAEVRAAKRAADLDAADGTKVYASVGAQKGRKSVDFGDGKPVDVSTIDDVDVAYKGKDGKVHVVEVKNTANATTQASLPAQAKRLADWAKESGVTPPRAARYQIETAKDWDKIFNGFQKDKKTGTTPSGTPAQTFADNGLGARIAGQDVTPQQLRDMDAAWNSKTDAEKQAARDSGKMKDPKSAMEYLGVS